MGKRVASIMVVMLGTTLVAAPVLPGTLRVVTLKEGNHKLNAQPKDVVEVRIPDPPLPKRVHDLDVEVRGDGILAGVVHTRDPKVLQSDRISIFLGLKGTARSATITFSYKDGEETEHKGKVTIQVIKKEKGS